MDETELKAEIDRCLEARCYMALDCPNCGRRRVEPHGGEHTGKRWAACEKCSWTSDFDAQWAEQKAREAAEDAEYAKQWAHLGRASAEDRERLE